MKRTDNSDKMDGKANSPLVVTSDYILEGIHQGNVHVKSGTLQLDGILQGALDVQSGAKVIINGEQKGPVTIASGASVTTIGSIRGNVVLETGAYLLIEEAGKFGGPLVNDGLVILRGVFGGEQSGRGELRIEGNGYIKEPVIRNGAKFYDMWQ